MGIAVIECGELVEWMVRNFDGPHSAGNIARVTKLVSRICLDFQVTAIACKLPDADRSKKERMKIVSTVARIACRNGIYFLSCTLDDMKSRCCKTIHPTKNHLVGCITHRYPELLGIRQKEETNRHSYYDKLFEAVTAAHIARGKEFVRLQ